MTGKDKVPKVGNEEDKDSQTQKESAEVAALKEQVKTLIGELSTLKNRVFSPEYIAALRGPEKKEEVVEEVNVNELDNKGVVDYLMKGVSGLLSEELKGLRSEIANIGARTTIESVRARHPDFDDVLPQMKELYARYPGIHPEDAYKLSKYGSPEAIAQFEEARAKKAKAAEDASHQTPRPGEGSSFNLEEVKNLPEDEAIAKAADEILTQF